VIAAGASIQSTINASPVGTAFCIQGEHRITTAIIPKDGDILQGTSGASINGSVVVSDWTAVGNNWSAAWPWPQPPLAGVCATGTACEYADDAFLDGIKLTRVLSQSQVGSGDVYIDYGSHKVYVGDNPANRTVEIAVASAAIDGNNNQVNGVQVSNLVVEKFANIAQYAALGRNQGTGWLIQNNDVRLNHGTGIEVGTGSIVRGNHVYNQGQQGMMAWMASGALVDGNEIDHNNTDGFDQAWEAGGAKWCKTINLTVINNYVHDNHGTGIWFDTDNIYAVLQNNTITNNDHHGIKYETSYDAVISGNVVTGNGIGSPYGGAGINVEASPNVEVFGNVVSGNGDGILLIAQNRGSGAYGPLVLSNAYVHGNSVTMPWGSTGLINYTSDQTYFSTKNNRYIADAYTLNCADPKQFKWSGTTADPPKWQGYGEDVTGSFGCVN
jgi:parallel beta-helix repeat protein